MRTASRLAAVAVLVAAAGTITPAPASAAACGTADGVTVVVDFNQLGGGVQQACVPDAGTAADLFVAAGHTLEDVQGQPFVCRVDGRPTQDREACVRTPPTNAYWGLWWSSGTSGAWSYATRSAYSLDVPDGGSVAFSWNGTSTRSQPSATPPDHTSEPHPQPSRPPSKATGGGSGGGAGSGGSGGDGPSPRQPAAAPTSASSDPAARGADDRVRERDRRAARDDRQERPRRDRDRDRDREERRSRGEGRHEERSDQATPSAVPDGAEVTSEPARVSGGGLPAWVAPTAIGILFAVAGGAAYLRRRTG